MVVIFLIILVISCNQTSEVVTWQLASDGWVTSKRKVQKCQQKSHHRPIYTNRWPINSMYARKKLWMNEWKRTQSRIKQAKNPLNPETNVSFIHHHLPAISHKFFIALIWNIFMKIFVFFVNYENICWIWWKIYFD